ncbi:hypothetical protein K3495_g6958 [Podosphaera aphanis]|nr:hypothetical protein K3495_g6958 [Podosphaera aphanis]
MSGLTVGISACPNSYSDAKSVDPRLLLVARINVVLLEDMQAVWDVLDESYRNQNEEEEARQALNLLRQKSRSFGSFLAEFKRLRNLARIEDDKTLIAALRAGVSDEMRGRISQQQDVRKSYTFDESVELCKECQTRLDLDKPARTPSFRPSIPQGKAPIPNRIVVEYKAFSQEIRTFTTNTMFRKIFGSGCSSKKNESSNNQPRREVSRRPQISSPIVRQSPPSTRRRVMEYVNRQSHPPKLEPEVKKQESTVDMSKLFKRPESNVQDTNHDMDRTLYEMPVPQHTDGMTVLGAAPVLGLVARTIPVALGRRKIT